VSRLHALLIGIDCYLPNHLPDGSRYESLSGSVRDIERVEGFLGGLKPKSVLKLTASRGPEGQPKEPRQSWPTYENIVAAFREVRDRAAPGDQVYIHYAGHGGRVATQFPELRGETGFDEGLVPCDIGDPQARYLRGPELDYLIQEMVGKGLIVNVVLDCCHSAGMRRSPAKAVRRGLDIVDTARRPTESLVASREEILGAARRQQATAAATAPVQHHLTLETSWLTTPQGYVLLAACRPQDCAYEFPFENGESQGALTYYLLKALREEGVGLTFQDLHDRIYAPILNQFTYQTPMVAGESDRPFLGTGPGRARSMGGSPEGILVLAIEEGRLLLNAGQGQGIRKGMRLAIHRPSGEIGDNSRPQAVVEIEEEGGAAESWAKIIETTRSLIRPGSRAVPIGLAPDLKKYQGVVGIVDAGSAEDRKALAKVRAAIAEDPSNYLRLPEEGDRIDFQVAVDGGCFAVLDADGKPIPHLGPPIAIHGPDPLVELLSILTHLTRYRNVLQIENADDESPLAGKIGLKILGTQKNFTPGDKPQPEPVGPGPVELQIGEWLFFEIANKSSRILNVAALDLQPDWGISQVFPSGKDASFWPLDPGETKVVRIKAYLPDHFDHSADIIKVFATMGAASYRWMLMPPLDSPDRKRHMTFSSFASEEWTAEQLELRVRR
jgi:hypothetical protein